jgi:hypothetical protein
LPDELEEKQKERMKKMFEKITGRGHEIEDFVEERNRELSKSFKKRIEEGELTRGVTKQIYDYLYEIFRGEDKTWSFYGIQSDLTFISRIIAEFYEDIEYELVHHNREGEGLSSSERVFETKKDEEIFKEKEDNTKKVTECIDEKGEIFKNKNPTSNKRFLAERITTHQMIGEVLDRFEDFWDPLWYEFPKGKLMEFIQKVNNSVKER